MNHSFSTNFGVLVSVLSLMIVASPALAATVHNDNGLAIIGGETLGVSGSASAMLGGDHASVGVTTGVPIGDTHRETMTIDVMSPLSIRRANLSTSGTSTVMSSSQVLTRDDLNTYTSSVIRQDSRVTGADFANDTVALSYQQPGKLFGFIPVTITLRTAVDAKGTVTISYPWYHFLVSSADMSRVKADIQEHATVMMQNSMNGSSSASSTASSSAQAGTHLSTKAQAELLDQIRAGFENVSLNNSAK